MAGQSEVLVPREQLSALEAL
eukprot:COSAG06_NODE_11795_length_1463_cov_31.065982_2_plen_20_part_01